jgi:bidirectional [NiFe] hydrogenase diaphorase subunit
MPVEANSVSLTIDGKKIRAAPGEMVLWAALDNDIYIPNLCAIREKSEPSASCRLCFVEVEGKDNPVTACTTPVTEGMVVSTKGAKALRLARTAFELQLASLPLDCAHCPKSGSCEIQKIAKHLGVKLNTKRFRKVLRTLPVDSSSPLYIYDANKCVLCGRCVWVCQEKVGKGVIGFAHRGFGRIVTTFGDDLEGRARCEDCSECVSVCPVGALTFRADRKPKPQK